jgi:alpha-N-arabinofuranosidase
MWGPWQVEQHSKEDYAKKAFQWAKALKLQDPAIKLILCGKNGHSDWDRYVLQECIKYTDMHSIHMYTSDKNHYANACSPRAAERAIEITASLIDLARCDFDYETWPDSISTKAKTPHKPTICFDEWNIWDPIAAPGERGAEQLYDVSDMLAVASWLNVFVRQAKYLGMATVAQSVNVISPLMTTERGVVRQTTYWPLMLFSKYMRGRSLAVHTRSQAYNGKTMPEWLATTMDLPLMDVSAALDDEGYVNLAVVNLHESDAAETKLPAIEGPVKVFTVGGNVNGIRDNNEESNEKVYIRESKWQGGESFSFEKHSFTLLRWKAEGVSLSSGAAVNGANGVSHEPVNGFHDEPTLIMTPVEHTNGTS